MSSTLLLSIIVSKIFWGKLESLGEKLSPRPPVDKPMTSALHKAGKQGTVLRYFSKHPGVSAIRLSLKIIKFKIMIVNYYYWACPLTMCVY